MVVTPVLHQALKMLDFNLVLKKHHFGAITLQ